MALHFPFFPQGFILSIKTHILKILIIFMIPFEVGRISWIELRNSLDIVGNWTRIYVWEIVKSSIIPPKHEVRVKLSTFIIVQISLIQIKHQILWKDTCKWISYTMKNTFHLPWSRHKLGWLTGKIFKTVSQFYSSQLFLVMHSN